MNNKMITIPYADAIEYGENTSALFKALWELTDLIRLESDLKKHHRAYLHVREDIDEKVKEARQIMTKVSVDMIGFYFKVDVPESSNSDENTPFADAADDEAVSIPKDKYELMIDDLLTMSEIIQCVADIQGTRDHNTFRFYAEQTYDECVARVIVPKAVKRGKVFGDVFEINYREQAANVAQNSVAPDHDRLTFADGYVLDAPCRSSFDAAMALVGEHGGVKTYQTLPKDADALAEVLSKQKSRRDRLPDAEKTEVLSPLSVAELRKYEAVKKAHPDALVCFAQNGYFELYGKDAEKAAPLLGTKLLEKKVRGKPSLPVTGFRETAWVAGSHKLWKSGADVFLSKDGETFKELKAADYIPVGATLNVDGIKCRIDAVDFTADEVRLTNIEDKNRPIRFSESIQYVRSYVEDAGTAIYDTIPKKPAARESIRDKLKSAQKAQPSHTPKPQKSKGKDMVL